MQDAKQDFGGYLAPAKQAEARAEPALSSAVAQFSSFSCETYCPREILDLCPVEKCPIYTH